MKKLENIKIIWKWVSVLSTVNTIRSGRSEVRISAQARDFSFLQNVLTCTRTQKTFHSKGKGVLSPWVKRPKRQAGYSFPFSADGKKKWR
jgi:hypothetical protein